MGYHTGINAEIDRKRDPAEESSTRAAPAMSETGGPALRSERPLRLVVPLAARLQCSLFGRSGQPGKSGRRRGIEAVFWAPLALLALSLLIVIDRVGRIKREPPHRKPLCAAMICPVSAGLRIRPSWAARGHRDRSVLTWLVMVALLAQVRLGQTDPGSRQATRYPTARRLPTPFSAPTDPLPVEEAWRYLTAGGVALVLLIVAGAILLRIRTRAPGPVGGDSGCCRRRRAGHTPRRLVAVAAELGLAVGDLNQEPGGDHRLLCRDGASARRRE